MNRPDGVPHIVRPPINVGLNDTNADHPQEYQQDFRVPGDQVLDHLDETKINCVEGEPSSNGCVFVDYNRLVQLDERTIRWSARNHGGRCTYTLGIYTRDIKAVVNRTEDQKWIDGKTFSVEVPNEATSAMVVGVLDGNDVVFSPLAALSAEDSKNFKALPPKQTPASTFYMFEVLRQV
jgi:hypothetical protein